MSSRTLITLMRWSAAAVAVLFFPLSTDALAYSEQVSFLPHNPTSGDFIQAVLSGESSCYFVNVPTVAKTGNVMVLSSAVNVPSPDTGCGGALIPYTQTAPLGSLAPGTYTVIWQFSPAVVAPITQQLVVVAAMPIPTIAKFEWLSGDRQIAVDSHVPPEPYVVRALDSEGNPVRGAALFIGTAGDPGQAYLQDEFHSRGFNTVGTLCYTCFGFVPPDYTAITDGNGVAQARGNYPDGPPSAFAVGVRQLGVTSSATAFVSAVIVKARPSGNPAVVVEYFNSAFGHYFNTIDQTEIGALDAGKFVGWKRSPGAFVAYPTAAVAPAGTVAVCRFFSSLFTSHFYTADPDECDTVISRWSDVWKLETREAFYIYAPDKASGTCAAGLQPIYRMYNNLPIPNHRYITDKVLRDRMTGAGWRAEGYGPDAVMMCSPG